MSKIGIVIQREYITRVRKKSFILLTFLMPVLFAGLIFGTYFLSQVKDDKAKVIVVVDETGKYLPVLKSSVQFQFVAAEDSFAVFREKSDEAVYATLVISDDLLKNPSAITLYSRKQVTIDTERNITQQLNAFLSDEKLASYNIPDLKKIIDESKISVQMKTIKWDDSGKEEVSSAGVATGVGMIFTFIIYIFIFVYGGMVMQGVLEEKTNRIVEVMVSSVKPFDLMMGKIIGIGLVGLTQFFLWAILVGIFNVIGGFAFTSPTSPDTMNAVSGSPGMIQNIHGLIGSANLLEITGYFVVYFIGGFMIYASLFAAIGAMVNAQEDTQQFMMPITILVLFAFYAGMYSLENPDGPLAFWTSMIPLTSPIVMMTRLPFDVPFWEKIVSVVLLFITVILLVKLSAKIYRVGILMYGKKPDIKEIVKWLKY